MSGDEKVARALLEKAQNDLRMAEIGLQHDAPLDTVCFHLQQAAEKMLKAALSSRLISFPLTHDLMQLLDLAEPEFAGLGAFRAGLSGFGAYAVGMRYDMSFSPDREETEAAWNTVKSLRAFLSTRLPPEIWP